VTALDREGDRYVITTDGAQFEADQVVVSTGAYQAGWVPAWAPELDRTIVQMHSSAYKNPAQIRPGGVLVVGAGNTGAELALEAARAGHDVWLSGRDVGQVPRFLRLANARPFFFLATHLVTNETPIGRKLARLMRAGHSSPLVRIRSKEIRAAGIRRVGRVTGSRGGQPVLEDGRVLDVATVLWCNGFRLDFSWIHLPIFDADGYPRHERGRVPPYPGLYFAGLPFQRNLASSTLVGANRDSAVVVGWIVDRLGLSATVGRQTMAAVRA
jgi:putative flavoprotein involved in K+ transport